MLRTVLLRHDLPDGSWHYDWMLERPPPAPDDRLLMTFRTTVRPDEATSQSFEGTRLPDHRALYLTYEGDLSGNRGRVTRVARGTYTADAHTDTSLSLAVQFDGAPHPVRVLASSKPDNIWIFSLQR